MKKKQLQPQTQSQNMSEDSEQNEELIPTLSSMQPEPVVIPPRTICETPTAAVAPDPSRPYDKLTAIAGSVVVTGLVVVAGMASWFNTETVTPVVASMPVLEVKEKPKTPNPYDTVVVQGKAVIVYDVREGTILHARNEAQSLPLASLTKLMTGLVAVESVSGDTHVAVTPYAIETEGDSGLFANESWKLKDLVSFTLLTSSNDGADALAAAVGGLWGSTPESVSDYERVDTFVSRMNMRARELGLSHTKFNNPSGLDESETMEGGVGSARDVAQLLTYIWENEPGVLEDTTLLEESYTSLDGFVHPAVNTNDYVYETPGLLGSKTGYTARAGGNLAVIYNAGLNHPIAVVVLGSTLEGRFSDVDALIDATYDYVESGWYEYEVAGSSAKI